MKIKTLIVTDASLDFETRQTESKIRQITFKKLVYTVCSSFRNPNTGDQ